MQAKKFFQKNFSKKFFSPKFKKIINKFFKTLCFSKPREAPQNWRPHFWYNRHILSGFISNLKIIKMKLEVDIFKNDQFYPTRGGSFNSKSNVAPGQHRKPRIWTLIKPGICKKSHPARTSPRARKGLKLLLSIGRAPRAPLRLRGGPCARARARAR